MIQGWLSKGIHGPAGNVFHPIIQIEQHAILLHTFIIHLR